MYKKPGVKITEEIKDMLPTKDKVPTKNPLYYMNGKFELDGVLINNITDSKEMTDFELRGLTPPIQINGDYLTFKLSSNPESGVRSDSCGLDTVVSFVRTNLNEINKNLGLFYYETAIDHLSKAMMCIREGRNIVQMQSND